jgi:CHASE2 domain-containing sensor protein
MFAKFKSLLRQPVILSSAIATVLLVGIQKLGVFETLEMRVYDQMVQLRADQGPDSRLLIVALTENDLQKWTWPLSGELLDRLLGKLEEYEPRAIGLDIFRDLPVQPGHDKLLQRLQQSDLIIPICKHSGFKNQGIAPPKGVEPERVGFSDVVEDTDSTIRRNLLLVSSDESDPCKSTYSFGLQLALKYLEVGGIQPEFTANQELKLRNIVFKPLKSNAGGYEKADTSGYQILLNYRSGHQIAQQVTITEILEDKVKPDLVKGRIVLVGSTASSLLDILNTPFASGKSDNSGKMAGIEIHAQSISQILSVVLNQQPLFWFIPEWGKVLWIWGWTVVGGLLVWRIQHPLALGLAGAIALSVLFVGNFMIFLQAGWLPIIPPILGLVFSGGSVLAYTAYQTKQEQKEITQRVQEHQQLIIELQALLRQRGDASNEAPTVIADSIGQEIALGTLLNNRYRITERLGSGGFSNTYLALDTKRPGNPQCVVKQLRPPRQDTEYLNVVRRLFDAEAEILEILGKHSQIPQLLAFFEEKRQFSLVQEFVAGHAMDKELTSGVRLKQTKVVEILKEVLQVLAFIHSYGVIHRDIKPSNLIRRESDGRIVLIDFGAVKQIHPQQVENHTISIGTPSYAPSEQMSGLPKLNSDIYALGIMGIQALTGVDPRVFRRDTNTGEIIIQTEPDGNTDVWHSWRDLAEVTNELVVILNKMAHFDFTQRYQSAAEVLKVLESI